MAFILGFFKKEREGDFACLKCCVLKSESKQNEKWRLFEKLAQNIRNFETVKREVLDIFGLDALFFLPDTHLLYIIYPFPVIAL